MADLPRNTDPDADTGVEPARGARPRISHWQKVVGILGFVVILWVGDDLLDNVLDRGPGGGGPGQEQDANPEDGGGHAPPEGGDDPEDGGGHAPPEGDDS